VKFNCDKVSVVTVSDALVSSGMTTPESINDWSSSTLSSDTPTEPSSWGDIVSQCLDSSEVESLKTCVKSFGYGAGTKYWNPRYALNCEAFEWLQGYDDVSDLLEAITMGNKSCSILHAGCGSSRLTERMYDEGYLSITNIDISSVVINQMKLRNLDMRPQMHWVVDDCTSMNCEDGKFDLVIDKGTIDTLLCQSDRDLAVSAFLEETKRVLKENGRYLCISLTPPDVLTKHFEESGFHACVSELPPKGTKAGQPVNRCWNYAYDCSLKCNF
jgi:SAM-dependent methyltransferase